MEKLWGDVLYLLKQGGIEHVSLRFVDARGALVERHTFISHIDSESYLKGIQIESGELVYPNPTTAILNPFLPNPTISFICDITKRPFDPVLSTDAYAYAKVPAIFPVIVAGRPTSGQIESSESNVSVASVCPALCMTTESEAPPQTVASDDGLSQPERSYRGTSCHQCKNARSLDHLAFCSNLFNRRSRQDKRHCRKKYCDGCLSKCYGDSIANSKRSGWICPSCSGICRCAACTRIRKKTKAEAFSSLSLSGENEATTNLSSGGEPSLPDAASGEKVTKFVDEILVSDGFSKSIRSPMSRRLNGNGQGLQVDSRVKSNEKGGRKINGTDEGYKSQVALGYSINLSQELSI